MKRTPDETSLALERLIEQVRELDSRVRALEALPHGAPPAFNEVRIEQLTSSPTSSAEPGVTLVPELAAAAGVPSELSVGLVGVWGKAVLGIAGAYLLRAAAESGTFPRLPIVVAGFVYALLWLLTSFRIRQDRRLVCVIYAGTAALIFLPMLWETTVQLKVLPPLVTAGLLVAFAALGSSVARTHSLVSVMWVTAVPSAATALVLMVALGELIPFVIALLAICAVVEGVDLLDRWAGIRPSVGFLADAGVALLIFVAGRAEQLETYKPVDRTIAALLCFALLGIYTVSVGYRTAGLGRRITLVEALQLAVAFALAVGGALRLTHAEVMLGTFCVLGAGVLYWAALARFNPITAGRNHAICTSFSLGLLLVGSVLLLPASAVAVLWAGFGVAAMFISARTGRRTLAIQGAVCVVASAFLSGLLDYDRLAMTGATRLALPSVVLWLVATGAVLSYVGCLRGPAGKWPRLVVASFAMLAVSSFLVTIISSLGTLSAAWLPAVRTVVICGLALLVGIGGARFPEKQTGIASRDEGSAEASKAEPSKRIELVWIGYAAMALVVMKVFMQDFRQSPPAALAVSLLCIGAVLLFGPRLIRLGTGR